MDSNYLYALDKSTVETFVENLDTAKADTSKTYQATYMSTKSSKVMETIDARTRLGTIENKEAIDALEDRIEALETKYANVDTTPTKRLVDTGNYEIKKAESSVSSVYFAWWNNPITGNGITVVRTRNGNDSGLYISRDGGLTYTDSMSGYTEETNGITYSYTFLRSAGLIFANNKFYIISNLLRYGKLYSTSDFIQFTSIDLPSDTTDTDLTYSRFIQTDDAIYILKNKNLYSLDTSNDSLTLLGTANVYIDYMVNYADEEDIFQKFDEKYYCVSNNKLYYTTDFLTYTVVSTNLTSIDSVRVENNNLIISDNDSILYSTDGSTWNTVSIPENYASNYQGLQVYYIDDEEKYYCLATSNKNGSGAIFVWSDLSSEPTILRDSSDTDITTGANLGDVELTLTKKFDGTMYFVATFLENSSSYGLFCIKNGTISLVMDMGSSSNNSTLAFSSNVSSSGGLWLCKINNKPYYICTSATNQSYIPISTYTLESYSSAQEGDTTFMVAL